MKTVSVVIPVYNEQENIPRAYDRVRKVMGELSGRYDYEIFFTDNHSTDRSFEILEELAQRDPRVRAARFSTNFGFQRSILTGYLMSRGDAIIQLDADLEDPPELIPTFLENWEKGFMVVYGVRRSRQEGRVKTWMRKGFYRLISALSEDPLPRDAGDFRLVDRRIVQELGKYYDCNPYIRGSIAAMGFRQLGIPYDRHARVAGHSKFNLSANLCLAMDGILSHSIIPLRFATFVGFATFVIAALLGAGYFVCRLFLNEKWPAGFTTTTLLLLLNLSLNSLFLGILGEYIGRIFRQSKNKPITIIEKTLNYEPVRPGAPQ